MLSMKEGLVILIHKGALLPSCSAVLIKVNVLFEKSSKVLKFIMNYLPKFIPVVQRSNFNDSINVII